MMTKRIVVLRTTLIALVGAAATLAAQAPATMNWPLHNLDLAGSRFAVSTEYVLADGTSGPGHTVGLTADTGAFWFFSGANLEMLLKVLDGCAVDGHFWVFAAGLTNAQVVTTVTDTRTGVAKRYVNPQGAAFAPVQDTRAFACP